MIYHWESVSTFNLAVLVFNDILRSKAMTRAKSTIVLLQALLLLSFFAGCSKEIADDSNPAHPKEFPLDDLRIVEICYKATEKKGQNNRSDVYGFDDYIMIANPTKETLYLDKLLLVTSPFVNRNGGVEYKVEGEERLNGNFLIKDAMMFPGSGRDYPIEPGKKVIVAKAAINHTLAQETTDPDGILIGAAEKSFDLSAADFQWMTEKQLIDEGLKNIPSTPHMIILCKNGEYKNRTEFEIGKNPTLLALVRIENPERTIRDENNDARYDSKEGGSTETQHAILLPLASVIDGVNFGDHNQNPKIWFDQFDRSCIEIRKEKLKKGYAIIRKHDGRNYVDENNSAKDFEVNPASMAKKKE